jgi:hypothetical protein
METPNYDIKPFEEEYPEEGRIMVDTFAGGLIISEYISSACPRNMECLCGSGAKTKKCHPEWTNRHIAFKRS